MTESEIRDLALVDDVTMDVLRKIEYWCRSNTDMDVDLYSDLNQRTQVVFLPTKASLEVVLAPKKE